MKYGYSREANSSDPLHYYNPINFFFIKFILNQALIYKTSILKPTLLHYYSIL